MSFTSPRTCSARRRSPLRWAATVGLSFAAFAVAGCASDEDSASEPADLVVLDDRTQWSEISVAADDPFLSHRPATVDCIDATWIAEAGSLELSTALCDYIALRQASLAELRVGDTIHLEAFHFDLTAAAPAQAHWAILVGDEVMWTKNPVIPGAAGYFSEDIVVQSDHPVGSPVVIHLHNHGQNTYGLKVLRRL